MGRLFDLFPLYGLFIPDGGTIHGNMIWILSGVIGVAWAMLLYGTGLIASRMVGVGCCILFFLFEFYIDLIHSFSLL